MEGRSKEVNQKSGQRVYKTCRVDWEGFSTRVPKRHKRESMEEEIFEETMANNFSELLIKHQSSKSGSPK